MCPLQRANEQENILPYFPPRDSKAARVLYSITVHPAPYGPGTQHVPQQKLVCLGTTTLAEIRDNLVVGGDNIPVEGPAGDQNHAENGSDAGDGSGEDRDAADEDGFDYSAQQPQKPSNEFFGGGSAAPASAREVRWKNERRVTGAAFIVEGTVYADKREGMHEDYARCEPALIFTLNHSLRKPSMLTIPLLFLPPLVFRCSIILNSIEETAWPGQPPAALEEDDHLAGEGSGMAQPAADDDDLTPLLAAKENGTHEVPSAVAVAAAAARTQPALRPHRGKPNLRRGTLAHQTTLGEMPLRVGQPYGFIHQGDVEHIWSVDEIRQVFPFRLLPREPSRVSQSGRLTLSGICLQCTASFGSLAVAARDCPQTVESVPAVPGPVPADDVPVAPVEQHVEQRALQALRTRSGRPRPPRRCPRGRNARARLPRVFRDAASRQAGLGGRGEAEEEGEGEAEKGQDAAAGRV